MTTLLDRDRFLESLARAPVIRKGDYDYLVHPLTDGVPRVEPDLLAAAVHGLARQIQDVLDERGASVDLLVTAEAMGLPLVAGLATRLDVPYVIARKRSYGLAGEIPLDQRTGYGHATLHLNGVRPGERVVIVDDLISTGGTLRALAAGIRAAGAVLVHVAAVVTKQADLQPLAHELDCSVSALAAVAIARDDDGTRRVVVSATDVRG